MEARRDRIADFVIASALAIYTLVWLAALGGIADLTPIGVAAITLTYVTMHVFENRVRGYCLMSADSIALPASMLVTLLVYWIHPLLSDRPVELGMLGTGFGVALIGGHVLAITWCAVLSGALDLVARGLRSLR